MKKTDFLIVGGGIVGLSIARELVRRRAGSICILEKEEKLGLHASGRNSGVLHAGLYYAPDSLKARFCAEGSRKMQDYAREHGITCIKTGKVVVAPEERLVAELGRLEERARANGVRVERLDLKKLSEKEPEAFTHGYALYSPDTAIIDSKAVLVAMESELKGRGVEMLKGSPLRTVDPKGEARTPKERIAFGHLINAAGLHADKVAQLFGAGSRYKIVPFKGWYRTLRPEAAGRIRGLIYPVPDPKLPFLGVHLTRHTDGSVTAGPTAFPAFGREHYGIWSGLDWLETPRIAASIAKLWLSDKNHFRRLTAEELSRCSKAGFYKATKQLAPFLKPEDILSEGKVGIRAQLVERETGKLEMDFVVENAVRSTHVLNAVSPGFTSAFAFAENVVEKFVLNSI